MSFLLLLGDAVLVKNSVSRGPIHLAAFGIQQSRSDPSAAERHLLLFAIRKYLIVISKIRAYGLCSDEYCIALLEAAVLTVLIQNLNCELQLR